MDGLIYISVMIGYLLFLGVILFGIIMHHSGTLRDKVNSLLITIFTSISGDGVTPGNTGEDGKTNGNTGQ